MTLLKFLIKKKIDKIFVKYSFYEKLNLIFYILNSHNIIYFLLLYFIINHHFLFIIFTRIIIKKLN